MVMSNAFSPRCVWFCLHMIPIKAKIWLRGSIPVLSPLIRQEGCQLLALCCRPNSQTSPLNWMLELSMRTECLLCPVQVSHRRRKGGRQETSTVGTHQAACIWVVEVKCVVDSSSVVSVGGLESVGCCKRGGNGSL